MYTDIPCSPQRMMKLFLHMPWTAVLPSLKHQRCSVITFLQTQANGRVQNLCYGSGMDWKFAVSRLRRFWSDHIGLVRISKHAEIQYTEVHFTIWLNKAKKTWYSLERWSDCYGARPPFFCEGLLSSVFTNCLSNLVNIKTRMM